MKKLGFIVMPLMAVSFLTGCNQPTPTPVIDVAHTFHFIGTNCKINGESDYSHDIYEKDKNVQYTIVPNTGYKLPETVEGVEYNPSNGVITINEIKNDIELRVEATHIPQPGTHTIHLDPAGGTITGDTILTDLPDGDPVTTAPTISRDGYDALEVKWYTEPDGKGEEFKFGPKGTGTDVVTDYFLHAKWGAKSTVQVEFVETSTKSKKIDVTYGDRVAYYKPTRAGFNFVDWYDNDPENPKVEAKLFKFETYITTPTSVYAKWEAISGETYNVKFNLTGCKATYKEQVVPEDGIDIAVPKDIPCYIKFAVNPSSGNITKYIDVSVKKEGGSLYSDYSYDKNNGDLLINLTSNVIVTAVNEESPLDKVSWEEIREISDSGDAEDTYNIGDIKHINILGLFDVAARIIGFNYDDLPNGNGKAGITFEFANLISAFQAYWNSAYLESPEREHYSSYDFINKSTLNDCLQSGGLIYEIMPKDLMDNIKTVTKYAEVSEGYRKPFNSTPYNTKLFPLSLGEIGGITEEESYAFYRGETQQEVQEKRKKGDGNYWLRSPNKDTPAFAWSINDDGTLCDNMTVEDQYLYVAPAFCI